MNPKTAPQTFLWKPSAFIKFAMRFPDSSVDEQKIHTAIPILSFKELQLNILSNYFLLTKEASRRSIFLKEVFQNLCYVILNVAFYFLLFNIVIILTLTYVLLYKFLFVIV